MMKKNLMLIIPIILFVVIAIIMWHNFSKDIDDINKNISAQQTVNDDIKASITSYQTSLKNIDVKESKKEHAKEIDTIKQFIKYQDAISKLSYNLDNPKDKDNKKIESLIKKIASVATFAEQESDSLKYLPFNSSVSYELAMTDDIFMTDDSSDNNVLILVKKDKKLAGYVIGNYNKDTNRLENVDYNIVQKMKEADIWKD